MSNSTNISRATRVLTAGAVALTLSGSAWAAQRPTTSPDAISLPAGADTQDTYGTTSNTAVWLPASAFNPHDSATTFIRTGNGSGATARTGGSGMFWTELNLPAGAIITRVETHHFDNSAANTGFACLVRYNVDTTYQVEESCGPNFAGTPGYAVAGYVPNALLATVNNRHPYVVHLYVDGNSPAYWFYGVRIVYRLAVSPSPAVATFPSDVPTTHPLFRFVEALAAAGVTGGCGTGQYCPDAPITRGQMAVFLSSALGLHFPDVATIP
jgi:hypothetical protein